MRLVSNRSPKLVKGISRELLRSELENDEDDDDDLVPRDAPTIHEEERKVDLALVIDLERKAFELGPGWDVWGQAVPGLETLEEGRAIFDLEWAARAAICSNVVVLLSRKVPELVRGCAEIRAAASKASRRRPLVLVGKFFDNEEAKFDELAEAGVDGVVVEHRDLGEAEIEAEMLRRTAANLPEKLMVDRGTWSFAPAVCVTGRQEVLELLPKSVAEFSLLDSPPREERHAPGGKLLVTSVPDVKTWWVEDFLVAGPSRLIWFPFARDPRVPPE